eukprot:2698713-Rhodomonas_salina.4
MRTEQPRTNVWADDDHHTEGEDTSSTARHFGELMALEPRTNTPSSAEEPGCFASIRVSGSQLSLQRVFRTRVWGGIRIAETPTCKSCCSRQMEPELR